MSLPLLKAALIITAGVSFISVTGNFHRTSVSERSNYKGLSLLSRFWQGSAMTTVPILLQIFVGAFTTVEALFTIADSYRSYPESQAVLNTLCGRYASSSHAAITPVFILGVAATAIGAYFRVLCFRELGTLFTFELTIRDNHKLITTGPYSVVRHPSYTAFMLMYAGLTATMVSPGSLWREGHVMETTVGQVASAFWGIILALVPVVISRAWKEDEEMERHFGDDWKAWARRVPYMYIPKIL